MFLPYSDVKEVETGTEIVYISAEEHDKEPDGTHDKVVCHECGKLVKRKLYEKHMRNHKFKCNFCPESFGTKKQLEGHRELHNDNPYTCEGCSLSFKSPLAFSFHNQKHSGFGIYKCPLCNFSTTKKGSMGPHIKLHNHDFKCVCEICGKGFLSTSAHANHMKLHEGMKPFQCDYCEKRFTLNRYLLAHQKLNHKDILNGVTEVFSCPVCKRGFKFEKSLVRHMSCIHNIGINRRVSCPICSKVIANNYNLKVHMRIHTGEKPYVCEVCKASFIRYKYLKKHVVKHNV